jgi:hypothetical protein
VTAYEELVSVDGGTHYLDDLAVTQIGATADLGEWNDQITRMPAGLTPTP